MRYSHNGKDGLTSRQFYESVLEHGDKDIQNFYNAMKFYRHKKDLEMIEEIRQKKKELFGIQGKGKKRLTTENSAIPKYKKSEMELKIKDENCINCKFAGRDKRKHEFANRVVCHNSKALKFEMPVDAKQVCRQRVGK